MLNADDTTEPTQYQCRHIKPDGHRCGSPSLRGEHFCYYHHTGRRAGPRQPQVVSATDRKSSTFQLPSPADLSEHSGVALALGLLLHKIAHNEIDPRRAGLLLYGLQIASTHSKRDRAQGPNGNPFYDEGEEITFDPDLGPLAPEAELGSNEPKSTVRRLIEEIESGARFDIRARSEDLPASIPRKSRLNPCASRTLGQKSPRGESERSHLGTTPPKVSLTI